MVQHFRDNWWVLVVRGALSVGAGVAALMFPAAALIALVAVFGVFAFTNGVFALASALLYRTNHSHGGVLAVQGVLGILAGLLAFVFPDAALIALVVAAAAWSLTTGALELYGAVRLREELRGEWMMALAGVLSIAFGVALLLQPLTGAITLLWLFVGYSLAWGLLLVAVGLSSRLWRGEHEPSRHSRPSFA